MLSHKRVKGPTELVDQRTNLQRNIRNMWVRVVHVSSIKCSDCKIKCWLRNNKRHCEVARSIELAICLSQRWDFDRHLKGRSLKSSDFGRRAAELFLIIEEVTKSSLATLHNFHSLTSLSSRNWARPRDVEWFPIGEPLTNELQLIRLCNESYRNCVKCSSHFPLTEQ